MGTTNDHAANDGKAPDTQRQNKKTPDQDFDTKNFIETHRVTKVARKAVPGAGEEAADLLPEKAPPDDRK